YHKAKNLSREGRYAEAERLTAEGVEKFKKSGFIDELHFELGWALSMQGKHDDAVGNFLWIEKQSKDMNLSSRAMCRIGDIYFDRKEYKASAECYDTVLNKYPDSFIADYAQYQLGNIFFATGKYDQSILAYQSVLVNFPNTNLREKVLFQLGAAYFERSDFEHATQEFKRLIKEFPAAASRLKAELYLANSLYNTENYEEALSMFRELESKSGEDDIRIQASYQSGWCYYNMGREKEALEKFAVFVKAYPGSPLAVDARLWFAEYYNSKNDYGKAKDYLLSILKDFPSSAMAEEALYQLALLLYEEGKADEAIARFDELASRSGNTELVNTVYRKVANIKKDRKEFDSAIFYFSKVLGADNNESNAQLQYEIAECYENKGEFAAAAEEYLKVPYLYSKGVFWSIRSQLKCAQVFERLGKPDEAARLYEKLADMDVEESVFAKKRLEWLKWEKKK
ncbi:MAG: tetratricopeptide repeat protein, partial [Candidatus Omnitrophica bacterium]|nr:tetratricopeptide repeat protein [Candidatus Omnitrophota bacterium]